MIRRVRRALLGIVSFALIFFVSGEIILRVFFASGETFTSHGGPIVARFERDFVFNKFDGPSRGPEPVDRRTPDQIRILVQGDSITWGQGIRDEQDLFSFRLLNLLRDDNLNVQMAVLAKPGREIDDHKEQLDRWGEAVAPNIIIYQWFVNDMELDHRGRPHARGRLWRRLFFHKTMMSHSYLWFFLDYGLGRALPKGSQRYQDYLLANYRAGSPRWEESVEIFREWLASAKRLTPNILVALYPMSDHEGKRALGAIYEDFSELCISEGVEVIDLWQPLSALAKQKELFASRYDDHPGAAAHDVIA